MEPVNDVPRGILRHGLNIDGVAAAVDDRRSSDSVWTDIPARQARGRSFSIRQDPGLPHYRRRASADTLRIHRVHRVVFGGHVQYVFVSLSGDRKLAEEERLTINLPI